MKKYILIQVQEENDIYPPDIYNTLDEAQREMKRRWEEYCDGEDDGYITPNEASGADSLSGLYTAWKIFEIKI